MEFNDFYSTNFTNEEIQEIKRFIFKNLNSSIDKTVEKFCNKYDIEVSKGYKIIQTESSKIRTVEMLKRLETETIDKIKILITYDQECCEKCQQHDMNIVEVNKAIIGVNVPPFHINCRCTMSAYIEELEKLIKNKGTKVARDLKGKHLEIPRNMSYIEYLKLIKNK